MLWQYHACEIIGKFNVKCHSGRKTCRGAIYKKSLVPNTVAIYEVYKSSHEDSVSKVIIEKYAATKYTKIKQVKKELRL